MAAPPALLFGLDGTLIGSVYQHLPAGFRYRYGVAGGGTNDRAAG
jgi:hypothetical protein